MFPAHGRPATRKHHNVEPSWAGTIHSPSSTEHLATATGLMRVFAPLTSELASCTREHSHARDSNSRAHQTRQAQRLSPTHYASGQEQSRKNETDGGPS